MPEDENKMFTTTIVYNDVQFIANKCVLIERKQIGDLVLRTSLVFSKITFANPLIGAYG